MSKDMQSRCQYHALDELMKGEANFRQMLATYSNEYFRAVATGRGMHLIKALRSYLDLVEVSLPEYQKRRYMERIHD